MVLEKPNIKRPSRCQTMSQSWYKHCLEDSTMLLLLNCGAGAIFYVTASLKLAKCPPVDSCNSGRTWTKHSLTLLFQLLDKYNLLLIIFAGWRLSQLYPLPIPTNYFHAIHKGKCGDAKDSNPHPTLLLAPWSGAQELVANWHQNKPFLNWPCPPLIGILVFLAWSRVSLIWRRQADKEITSISHRLLFS